MLPLQGKRILITRALGQSSSLQQMLEAQGAEVIAVPTIEIVPPDSYEALDAALRAINRYDDQDEDQYDWLVLTSVNAVRAMSSRAKTISVSLNDPTKIAIAAIGSTTANAITALGLKVSLVSPKPVAESLAAALSSRVQGKRVLLVRARVARDVLPQMLTAAGAAVTIAEAYQTVIPPQSADALRSAFSAHIDAVTFSSASSVHNFFELAATAQLVIPATLKKISIGPITTRAIQEHGWQVDAEAEQANMEAMTAAVVQACSQ